MRNHPHPGRIVRQDFLEPVRLSKAFGPSPDMWVRLQANYDLSQVRQGEIRVARYKRAS